MDTQNALRKVISRQDLDHQEMRSVMQDIMSGQATPSQIAGFLVALRMKGETITEITAAAEVMRELATPVQIEDPHLVDIVGTGGDGLSTFNISTASALVVAAAGGKVAKHGNRSVSSKSGSADLLEIAGVELKLSPENLARCIAEVGVGFMFAPLHHGAMKHAIGPRKEMGIRTLFNLLGPLTNPAKAPNMLLGVYSADWLEALAEVLKRLGCQHVLVVHAEDGMDEISIGATTKITELHHGKIQSYTITPEQFGFQRADINQLAVADAAESLQRIQALLKNTPGPALDIVLLNAGAAIYAANIEDNVMKGIDRAREVIANGAAEKKLEMLRQFTQAAKA